MVISWHSSVRKFQFYRKSFPTYVFLSSAWMLMDSYSVCSFYCPIHLMHSCPQLGQWDYLPPPLPPPSHHHHSVCSCVLLTHPCHFVSIFFFLNNMFQSLLVFFGLTLESANSPRIPGFCFYRGIVLRNQHLGR